MSNQLITGGEVGFREYLNSDTMIARLDSVSSKYLTPQELVKSAMTSIIKTPRLLDCTKESWAISLMQALVIGLKIGQPFNHACFVPFKNSKKGVTECTFMPMYQGLIYLAMDSGIVNYVDARTVYVDDDFDFEYGSNPYVKHRVDLDSPNRENKDILYFYSVIKCKDSDTPLIRVMTKKEVDLIKARSAASKDSYSPWNGSDYPDMGQKTVYKKNQKYAPIAQTRRLATALEFDDNANLGIQPKEQELIQPAIEEVKDDKPLSEKTVEEMD